MDVMAENPNEDLEDEEAESASGQGPQSSSDDDPRVCRCPKSCEPCFAIVQLLDQPLRERTFYPRMYLGASHEVFALTLIITWLITYILYPSQIFQHPARSIIGSYNPCFGWDYPPASYIALVCCSCNVYFTWRYAWLCHVRLSLLRHAKHMPTQTFAKATSVFLAASSNMWLLLFILGPNADLPKPGPDDLPFRIPGHGHIRGEDGPTVIYWFIHTGIFMMYALASYLTALGNYLEVRHGVMKNTIEQKHTIFMIVYGTSMAYLTFVYMVNLVRYEQGTPPAVHPILTQIADFFWMACVALITTFLPEQPKMKVITEIIMDEDVNTPNDDL